MVVKQSHKPHIIEQCVLLLCRGIFLDCIKQLFIPLLFPESNYFLGQLYCTESGTRSGSVLQPRVRSAKVSRIQECCRKWLKIEMKLQQGRKPYIITQSRHHDRVVLAGTSVMLYAAAENTVSAWTWKAALPPSWMAAEHIGFVYVSLCFSLTVPGTWHFPSRCISVFFVLQCQVMLSGWQVGRVSERVSLTIWLVPFFLCLLRWIQFFFITFFFPGQLCARLRPPGSKWSKLGLVEWTELSGESGKF